MRLRSAGWLLANQIVAGAVAFVSSILIAQELGPSGKGTVTVVQTITSLAGVILAAGLPGTAGFLAARRKVDGPTESRVAWLAAVVATAITAIIAFPFAGWLTDELFQSDSTVYLWVALAAIAPTIAAQILAGFLLGVGRARAVAMVNIGSAVTSMAGLVVLTLAGQLTISAFLALWLVLLCAFALVQTLLLMRMPKCQQSSSVLATFRLGARFGAASWASSSFHLLALRVDILVLSALAGSAAVGVYSVGATLAEVGWYVPNALYAVLFPAVAAEGKRAQELIARTARIVWPLVLIIGVVLTVLTSIVVVPFYGADFSGAIGVVLVLVPGMTTGAVANVLSAYLGGRAKPGLATVGALVNLLVNVAACLILIPLFEEIGAAAASSISYSCAACVIAYFFCRDTGMPLRAILIPRRPDFTEGRALLNEWLGPAR